MLNPLQDRLVAKLIPNQLVELVLVLGAGAAVAPAVAAFTAPTGTAGPLLLLILVVVVVWPPSLPATNRVATFGTTFRAFIVKSTGNTAARGRR